MKKELILVISLLIFAFSLMLFGKKSVYERIKSAEGKTLNSINTFERNAKNEISGRERELAKRIEAIWDKIELSSRVDYVVYSDDLKVKRVVAFEEGCVKVEVIEKSDLENQSAMLSKIKKGIIAATNTSDNSGANVLKGQISLKTLKSSSKNVKREKFKASDGVVRVKYSVKIPLKEGHMKERAKIYFPLILKNAKKFNLPPDMVLAIVEAESSFNPHADNGIAYGLMQLVPTSAYDAARTAFGKKRKVSKHDLKNPDLNVLLGCALLSQYLRWKAYLGNYSHDMYKHELMGVASYNCGAGRISRWIAKHPSYMKLTKKSFFDKLYVFVPRETKRYIQKVPKKRALYKTMFR